MAAELTASQRTELIRDLRFLESQVASSLLSTGTRAETDHLDQTAVGRVSRGDALQAQSMAKEQHRRLELRSKQIAVAIAAVEDEQYGDCKACDEPIGYGRLKARPECVLCVDCTAERGG